MKQTPCLPAGKKVCGTKKFYKMRMIVLMIWVCMLSCGTATVENKEAMTTKKDSNIVKKVALVETSVPQVDSTITVDYLMGKFEPSKDARFVKLSTEYASSASMLLRKEAYEAFKEMYAAAKKEGISFKIISATRPFSHQKRIWEGKWNGTRKVEGKDLSKTHQDATKRALKILEYSSMPGSSRHHWGTDIDINNLENEYFEKGKGKKEYDWLVANAPRFGFCQPYSPIGDTRPFGYYEEKWHWSYLPISQKLTAQYKLRIRNEDVLGFDGAEVAPQVDIVNKYVLGINEECL
ncbi:MAG: D-alanyl-D-alanine carboxypeptidase [Saprospiraceae bacterium]|jgi:D-alanyl-D-alanine carboxypeptidase